MAHVYDGDHTVLPATHTQTCLYSLWLVLIAQRDSQAELTWVAVIDTIKSFFHHSFETVCRLRDVNGTRHVYMSYHRHLQSTASKCSTLQF